MSDIPNMYQRYADTMHKLDRNKTVARNASAGLGATLGGIAGNFLGKKRDEKEKEQYGLESSAGEIGGTIAGTALGALGGNAMRNLYLNKKASIINLGLRKLANLEQVPEFEPPKPPKQQGKNPPKKKGPDTPNVSNNNQSQGQQKTSSLKEVLESGIGSNEINNATNSLARDIRREKLKEVLKGATKKVNRGRRKQLF